jgi:hypothetical protein
MEEKIIMRRSQWNCTIALVLGGWLSGAIVPVAAQQSGQWLPFFDNVDNPVQVGFPTNQRVDISPSAPELTVFDRAVLRTCGPIGSRVSRAQFAQLLSYFPDVVQKAKQVTGGSLFRGRTSDAAFREDLSAIWMNEQGFEHIFCGELYSADDIGGLHFYGRYLELQQNNQGGRLPNNSQREEVVPGLIYTMGVVIRRGNRTYRDVIKGYPYVSNALELFLDTTSAFKRRGAKDGACLYTVRDRETGKSYQAVFVRERDAIITFYSDATPRGESCGS